MYLLMPIVNHKSPCLQKLRLRNKTKGSEISLSVISAPRRFSDSKHIELIICNDVIIIRHLRRNFDMENTRELRDNQEEVVVTTCHSHCGGACPLKVHVKDGTISKIETDYGEEPQYRACARGRGYRQRVYAPDRIKHPMKRIGERGKGEFERVSWDEALDTVASEIKRVKECFGPSANLLLSSRGDVAWLHNDALFEKLLIGAGGYSGSWGSPSGEAGLFALITSYGVPGMGNSREDLLNSRLIILWGWNPAVNCSFGNTRLYLAQAREAGTKIIAVDPRHTDSAAVFAHQWIPIRPGTDSAMLIAMAYVMIAERLQDQAFLDKYTYGFERFKDYVLGKEDCLSKTPVWAEDITGVSRDTIASLAREFAITKPAAIIDGFAAGRSAHGEQFHRATITLAAMTGNIGIPGGSAPGGGAGMGDASPGLSLGPRAAMNIGGRENPVDMGAPTRKDAVVAKWMERVSLYTGASSARVHWAHIADAILKGRQGGYPTDYKLLLLVNTNYVNQISNTNKIVRALKKLEFIVILEQFMTPTARYADIILPTNTFLERNDLTTGGIGPYYGYMNEVIDSLGESKSQYEIAVELAARLGITDFSNKTEEDWLREIVQGCKDIPDYETFKKAGIYKVKFAQPYVCFQNQISDPVNNPFPTQSGKIELYSQEIAALGNPMLPAIPKYIENWESRNDPLAQKYPLQLVTTHTLRRAHTQFDNIPWLRELYLQAITINANDAQDRGINHGDLVRVYNDRGEMLIPTRVTERIMPGVVDMPQGAWYDPDENGVDRGGCANILTKDVTSPGGAFVSNTALVQVERVQ
jgi:anaerobic dimethyl sulfoxide reductase subunit A